MISSFSSLSKEQLTIVQLILTTLRKIRQDHRDNLDSDMRLVAVALEGFLSERAHTLGWSIFVISATHHTSNIILACVPANKDAIAKSFVLKAEVSSSLRFKKLKSEAAFYQIHQSNCLPSFFGFFTEENVGAIALDYLDGYQKLSTMLWQEDITKSHAHKLFASILDRVSVDLFLNGQPEELSVDDNWTLFSNLFLDRALSRLSEKAISSSFLGRIVLLREYTINDVLLPGPVILLKILAKEGRFIANSLPAEAGYIHGDLHFGNILIKKERSKQSLPKLALVDPHFFQRAPLVYDLGKMYQSFAGHYEAIMRGAYITESVNNNSFALHFFEPPHYVLYGKDLEGCIGDFWFRLYPDYNVVDWHLICTLATGIHLMAAAPHHVFQEKEATALLLWGCFLTFTAYEKLKLESKS